jgi:TonB-dependent starch-binding outer membrane protein SusC
MLRAGLALLAVALATGCAASGAAPSPSSAVNPAPEDQVSVGYGTQSRRKVTGAVSSFTPTEADARVGRVEFMLQGRVPGLEVVPLPNGSYTLRIRGLHGLRGRATDDEPLLVIDDIPAPRGSLGSALAGLAPRDVARIDVLKDAGAAAVYGSRGANGVIIITTKRAP